MESSEPIGCQHEGDFLEFLFVSGLLANCEMDSQAVHIPSGCRDTLSELHDLAFRLVDALSRRYEVVHWSGHSTLSMRSSSLAARDPLRTLSVIATLSPK